MQAFSGDEVGFWGRYWTVAVDIFVGQIDRVRLHAIGKLDAFNLFLEVGEEGAFGGELFDLIFEILVCLNLFLLQGCLLLVFILLEHRFVELIAQTRSSNH